MDFILAALFLAATILVAIILLHDLLKEFSKVSITSKQSFIRLILVAITTIVLLVAFILYLTLSTGKVSYILATIGT
ncbi:hypothetical protein Ciccas_011743, partial [Cichlidogyrus casuarinus]